MYSSSISKQNSDLGNVNHLDTYCMVDKFSSIPIINGFHFHFVVYSGIDQDAPEKICTDWWWNVITFGDIARLTEIAFCPFRDKGSIYIRQKHDNDWSEWFKH